MKHKPLPKNTRDWPKEWLFLFDERAGMMEHHGCVPKPIAERDAEKQIRKMHKESANR
tara:strand:- start:240 stop:413 length:174 start_codon:yes stop_codon:yes gene_type:complete